MVPMLVGYIRREIYYLQRMMCLLFTYSAIVQTKKKLTFYLCATMIMLCQMKNEHSWSMPLVVVRYFGLVCFHNKTRTGLLTSCFLQSRGMIPILNNCCESTIRRHWIAEKSYSHGLFLDIGIEHMGGEFENVTQLDFRRDKCAEVIISCSSE